MCPVCVGLPSDRYIYSDNVPGYYAGLSSDSFRYLALRDKLQIFWIGIIVNEYWKYASQLCNQQLFQKMLTGFCGSVVPTFSENNMNLFWKTRMPGTYWAILSDRFRYADTVPGYVAGLSSNINSVPRYVPGYPMTDLYIQTMCPCMCRAIIQTQTVYSGMCLDSH